MQPSHGQYLVIGIVNIALGAIWIGADWKGLREIVQHNRLAFGGVLWVVAGLLAFIGSCRGRLREAWGGKGQERQGQIKKAED